MKKVKVFRFDIPVLGERKKILLAEETLNEFIQNKTIISFTQSSNSLPGVVVYTIIYEED